MRALLPWALEADLRIPHCLRLLRGQIQWQLLLEGSQKWELAAAEASNAITDNEKVLLPRASSESELRAWLCPRECRENKILSVSS